MNGKLSRNRIGLGVLLVVLIFSAGCSKSQEVSINEQANGSQITIKQGETFDITLDANMTTGYRWEVKESDTAVLKQLGQAEYKASTTGGTPIVGAGGTQTFHFQAVGPGQTKLVLVYHRPWETGVEPAKTFSVDVSVG